MKEDKQMNKFQYASLSLKSKHPNQIAIHLISKITKDLPENPYCEIRTNNWLMRVIYFKSPSKIPKSDMKNLIDKCKIKKDMKNGIFVAIWDTKGKYPDRVKKFTNMNSLVKYFEKEYLYLKMIGGDVND